MSEKQQQQQQPTESSSSRSSIAKEFSESNKRFEELISRRPTTRIVYSGPYPHNAHQANQQPNQLKNALNQAVRNKKTHVLQEYKERSEMLDSIIRSMNSSSSSFSKSSDSGRSTPGSGNMSTTQTAASSGAAAPVSRQVSVREVVLNSLTALPAGAIFAIPPMKQEEAPPKDPELKNTW